MDFWVLVRCLRLKFRVSKLLKLGRMRFGHVRKILVRLRVGIVLMILLLKLLFGRRKLNLLLLMILGRLWRLLMLLRVLIVLLMLFMRNVLL